MGKLFDWPETRLLKEKLSLSENHIRLQANRTAIRLSTSHSEFLFSFRSLSS